MKAKRNKQVKKILGFYENNFGFRLPYQVLVDGTFCYAALQNQIHIADNLPRYLQGEILLFTTSCVIIEMEKFGSKVIGALLILKQFGVHKCGHEKKAIPGAECLLSMLGKRNERHYILATQDKDLENKVRQIPGAALLYLHSKTPILEKPSMASVSFAKEKVAGIGTIQSGELKKLKEAHGIVEENLKKPRKKKIKGPNPLSCMKKKGKKNKQNLKANSETTELPQKEKPKKKKIRYSKHIKDEIKQGNLVVVKEEAQKISSEKHG
ncbi:rRNA-processing protein UTP23 homolog [Coccinella septempunctata]|uniref:rRNA-processing protein UTP23 homolog n=1 Tax=Coccinella septempunctata TaxID=41139 RepID=UPI001D07F979|nr:rRNA-processing protein UTP23 homolog [Coccinella septempunctata]XP_044753078.1 rRNA-processing protein UTP23 homolog [Coccinella septempunctata]